MPTEKGQTENNVSALPTKVMSSLPNTIYILLNQPEEKNAFTYLTNRPASEGLADPGGRGENYISYQFNLHFFIMMGLFLTAYSKVIDKP